MNPPCLAGTEIASTMLQASLLLRNLAMGQEMSAKAPFAMRPVATMLAARGLSDRELSCLRSIPTREQEDADEAKGEARPPRPQPIAGSLWWDVPDEVPVAQQDEAGGSMSCTIGTPALRVQFKAFLEEDKK